MTQRVLDAIAADPDGIAINLLDTLMRPTIPLAEERVVIVTTLQSHYLIQNHNGLLTVTPKGQEYLRFRGPLPPVMPTPPANPG
jgi:hypothetical protein